MTIYYKTNNYFRYIINLVVERYDKISQKNLFKKLLTSNTENVKIMKSLESDKII